MACERNYFRCCCIRVIIALIVGIATGLATTIIGEVLAANFAPLASIIFFIGGFVFIGLAFYGMMGANALGIGLLHDEYVEIKLKDRVYKINYSKIIKIDEKFFTLSGFYRHWHIHIHDEPTLTLRQGSGLKRKTNLYPLEKFMSAVNKRLKPEQY